MRRMILSVCAVLGLSLGTLQAEQIDNPGYAAWAKYKAGTMVKQKTESDAGGQKTVIQTTTTLKEVTPEKVVLEIATSMEAGGQTMSMPAQTTDIPAKMEKPTAEQQKQIDEAKAKAQAKESEETIEVAGKKVKAKVVEATTEVQGMKLKSKTWQSDEIPGGLAKMTSSSEGEPKMNTTITVTEISVK